MNKPAITIDRPAVIAALLFALTFLIYAPILISAEFVWDDIWYVVRNEAIRSWSFAPHYFTDVSTMAGERFMPLFRPIRNLTYTLDYSLWGLQPAGWHLQNIFWHAVCVVLAFYLARSISRRGSAAAVIAALIFCVHPAVIESVAWIKSRDSLLSGVFTLAALIVFLRAHDRAVGWRWGAGVALLFTVAVYSYLLSLGALIVGAAMAILLPGDAWRRNRPALLALGGVLTLISILFILHRWAFIGRMGQTDYIVGGSAFWTLVTMVPAAATYLRLLIFPLHLNADYFNYPHYMTFGSPAVIGSLALLLGLAGASLWLWRRGQPMLLLALVWIAAFLLPVSNMVPTMQILAERFLYLPVFAVAMLAGHYWPIANGAVSARKRLAGSMALALLLAALLVRTEFRLLDWTDEYSLFESTWLADPENCRAIKNFGVAKFNNEEWSDALILLEEHRGKCESDADIYRCLGFSYARTGQPAMAIAALDEGLRKFPAVTRLAVIKALIASEAGHRDTALETIYAVQSKAMANPELKFLIAVSWQNLDEFEEARRLYESLLPARPADPMLRLNLARVLVRMDERPAAREQYLELQRLDPQNEEAARMLDTLAE